MNRRESKVHIHRNPVAATVKGLSSARFLNLTIVDVHGLLKNLEAHSYHHTSVTRGRLLGRVIHRASPRTHTDSETVVATLGSGPLRSIPPPGKRRPSARG